MSQPPSLGELGFNPQLDLSLSPHVPDIVPVERRYETLAERFEAFHAANPAVFEAILGIARELKHRRWKRCSMNYVFERLRWLYMIRTNGSEFRLNNSFRAFYARLAMAYDESLVGFFSVRVQHSQAGGEYEPDLGRLGLARG